MRRTWVSVHIDRPLGSAHPKHPDILYPINYGYVPGIMGGDGEAQDAYVLGIDHAIRQFDGWVAAIIHRRNDVEDKWVVVPEGFDPTEEEIRAATHFQEQYFDSWIELTSMDS